MKSVSERDGNERWNPVAVTELYAMFCSFAASSWNTVIILSEMRVQERRKNR